MLDVLIEYLIVRFKDIKSVLHEMGVTEGKLERFRNEWNTRKLSLQRKNTKYYEDKSNREGKIIRTTSTFGQ